MAVRYWALFHKNTSGLFLISCHSRYHFFFDSFLDGAHYWSMDWKNRAIERNPNFIISSKWIRGFGCTLCRYFWNRPLRWECIRKNIAIVWTQFLIDLNFWNLDNKMDFSNRINFIFNNRTNVEHRIQYLSRKRLDSLHS